MVSLVLKDQKGTCVLQHLLSSYRVSGVGLGAFQSQPHLIFPWTPYGRRNGLSFTDEKNETTAVSDLD